MVKHILAMVIQLAGLVTQFPRMVMQSPGTITQLLGMVTKPKTGITEIYRYNLQIRWKKVCVGQVIEMLLTLPLIWPIINPHIESVH